jgi:hypothetical protein
MASWLMKVLLRSKPSIEVAPDAMMKDDLNVIGIKICNGVSRKMTVDHDTVIQPTKMALVSVPEEWHWSQWTKMTVGV